MIRVHILFLLFIFVSCGINTDKKVCKINTNRFTNSKILWNLDSLSHPPAFAWIDSTSSVRSLKYESVSFQGKPTEVFAYYSNPDLLQGKVTGASFPAVVLVHGGGGKAFKAWVEKWAADGYAAIAMDLGAKDAEGNTLLNAGPDQSHKNKFTIIEKGELKNVWTYHAVASIILAHSFLLNRPEVNAEKTCLTGISWGGYLTCIVAGLDDRFKAAAPVYGCAYYDESDAFSKPLSELSPFYEKQWMKYFDPSVYLPFAKPALLFMDGNKDYFYNILPYYKTYKLPQNCEKNICLKPNMQHGHLQGWQPIEIRYFFESIVNNGVPLPKLKEIKRSQSLLSAEFNSMVELRSARFYYSSDTISSNAKRVWLDLPASIHQDKNEIRCDMPDVDFKYAFFYVTDNREVSVSSPIYVQP